MSEPATILHATTIAMRLDGGWRGVLLRGPSGAGKSDLAIRAMAQGWRLVADDRTIVWMSGGGVFARAPQPIAGLVEARHVGVSPVATLKLVALALVVDCVSSLDALERTPEPATAQLLQARLPCVRTWARETSAVAKLVLALQIQQRL